MDRPPKYALRDLMGDNSRTDLIIYLSEFQRPVSIGKIFRDLDHPREAILGDLRKLNEFAALRSPKIGMYQLRNYIVGRRFRELQYEVTEQARSTEGLCSSEELITR